MYLACFLHILGREGILGLRRCGAFLWLVLLPLERNLITHPSFIWIMPQASAPLLHSLSEKEIRWNPMATLILRACKPGKACWFSFSTCYLLSIEKAKILLIREGEQRVRSDHLEATEGFLGSVYSPLGTLCHYLYLCAFLIVLTKWNVAFLVNRMIAWSCILLKIFGT